MKKLTKLSALILALAMLLALTACGGGTASDAGSDSYTIGICQLVQHDALDAATQGFKDALTEKLGDKVKFDEQNASGEKTNCATIVDGFVADGVDLIMANATAPLQTAASATNTIPVLGTSVTDYNDTFDGEIPENVSGTSDAVPFDEQAKMMIDTLGLAAGDQVGVLYCTNESNSLIQYEAVKALFEAEGIVVKAYTFSETTELQTVTTSMASECKAVYVPSDNTVASNDAIVGTICTEKNVPIYTSYGGAVCYASLAIDYYQLGYETGLMAAEILLNGKSPADMAVKTLVPTVAYNAELCAQLGIEVPAN